MPIRFLLLGAALMTACFATGEDEATVDIPLVQPIQASSQDNAVYAPYTKPGEDCRDKELVLKQKVADLAALQREVDQLQSEIGQRQRILVRVDMLEVSLSKLRKCGLTNQLPNFSIGSVETGGLLGINKRVLDEWSLQKSYTKPADCSAGAIIGWLEENRFARVIARPSLLVTPGQAGSIFQGEEIPIQAGGDSGKSEPLKCGTELDVLALPQADDRVRLQLRVRVSSRDESNAVITASTTPHPKQTRQVSTAIETKFGDAVALCGLRQERTESVKTDKGVVKDEQNEIALLVVITPERVNAVAEVESKRDRISK